MSIHNVVSICPICSHVSQFGHADMAGHELKHLCPKCKARHYGEPVKDDAGNFVCAKCNEASKPEGWEQIPLSAGEAVQGPVQSCAKCNHQLSEGRIAFIEIKPGTTGEEGRTGRVFFIKPDKAFLKSIGDQKAVYIEKPVLAKMVKNLPE